MLSYAEQPVWQRQTLVGMTMHRIFAIPVPACGADLKKIDQSRIKPLIKADVVIIDEISMCRNDTFSFMYKVLKKAERLKGKRIRLIVVGDFSQLPPVSQLRTPNY